ncbi:MAG TPA: histidinol dehydrogenase, partial [Clostridiales bacterium]|nr:histidinol dehydrogenase [Clostridiales bacterium]
MLDIIKASDAEQIKRRLLLRAQSDYTEQQRVVDGILADVRERGNAALFAYTKKFDRFDVDANTIEMTEREIEQAYAQVDGGLLDVMKRSAKNIEAFHNLQRREDWTMDVGNGATLGQRYTPVESAGVYVPGGKAAYPSSVLMNIIPAKCAGVEAIYVATPAMDGKVNPATVAAAHLAGAHRIFKMGGAQAVAAFAYGTESVPRTVKITGPGNIYVALAKKSVFGQVGIDMIAGPSEVLIIADNHANPRYVAADFLSQAEHDELAACVLVTDDGATAQKIRAEILAQAETLSRREIVMASLENYGTVIVCADLEECAAIANQIAPEHLEICTKDPGALLPKIKNAGSIFLGEYSPEPLGDYFAGVNHVLPTNGTAKFSSPLSVDDFQKKSGVLYYTKEKFA